MGLAFSPVRPRACSAKRTPPVFSLWLTARTTNCSSTLKKGASRSKSLLSDRGPLSVRQVARTAPLVWAITPTFSSQSCAPAFSPLLPPTFFAPRPPLFFQPRAFAVCFRLSPCRSYRRFVSPRRPTRPHSAARRLRPTLRIVVSPVRAPSVCPVALSPLCPDAYTPNGFVFRTTTPCDPFRPRAGFPIKQITPSPPYVFNRATSKFSPTPSARKPISPLGFERLPRVSSSARAPVPVPNKQEFLALYIFNRGTSVFSHSVRLALRRCIAAHETASHPRFASKPEVAAHACFFCLTAARGLLPCLLPPRAFFLLVFRGCASVYCGVSVAPACRGLRHRRRARTKVGDWL